MATGKQSPMLLYLIAIFGFVMGYIYTMQSDPTAVVPVLDNKFQLSTMKDLQNARIDQTLFTSDQYKALQVFGSLPVQPEGGGKDNPFQ